MKETTLEALFQILGRIEYAKQVYVSDTQEHQELAKLAGEVSATIRVFVEDIANED
jgi:hypothetical protein